MGAGNSKAKEEKEEKKRQKQEAKAKAKADKEAEKARKKAEKEEKKKNKKKGKKGDDGEPSARQSRKSIVEASMIGPQLGLLEVEDLIRRIKDNDKTLVDINLNNNSTLLKMDETKRAEKQRELAQALAHNKHVDALLMANCMVDDSVAEAIAEALKTNTSITTLNLESNRITGQGVIPLARMLTVNTTLRDLRLNNQYKMVSTEAEEVIGECIVQNNTLLRFNLDIRTTHVRERVQRQLALNMDRQRQERVKDHVPDPDKANLTPLQRKIMSVVSNNYDEEELELSTDMEFTKMKDDEKVALASGMATNTRIKVLKLNKVMIKDSFAEAMGKSLATNTTLEVLALESNSITGVGIVALANGLKANKTLKELKLQGQEKAASTEAENALMDALEVNTTLVKLGLQIRDATARDRIDKALRRNADLLRKARVAAGGGATSPPLSPTGASAPTSPTSPASAKSPSSPKT